MPSAGKLSVAVKSHHRRLSDAVDAEDRQADDIAIVNSGYDRSLDLPFDNALEMHDSTN